jgi:hypothetical protein
MSEFVCPCGNTTASFSIRPSPYRACNLHSTRLSSGQALRRPGGCAPFRMDTTIAEPHPRHFASLTPLTSWSTCPPSPCGRLSRPRTTMGAPSPWGSRPTGDLDLSPTLTMNGVPPCPRPIVPSRLGDGGLPRGDRVRRGVHLLLALYLLPAVLILGGLLVLLEALARRGGTCDFVRALLGRGSREQFLMAGGNGRPYDLAPGVQATLRWQGRDQSPRAPSGSMDRA